MSRFYPTALARNPATVLASRSFLDFIFVSSTLPADFAPNLKQKQGEALALVYRFLIDFRRFLIKFQEIRDEKVSIDCFI